MEIASGRTLHTLSLSAVKGSSLCHRLPLVHFFTRPMPLPTSTGPCPSSSSLSRELKMHPIGRHRSGES
jgi:hypothetical protein